MTGDLIRNKIAIKLRKSQELHHKVFQGQFKVKQ